MNVKESDRGGYTLPLALIILSLLFTIAGIAVAGLAQQSEETRYFKSYQLFLLDCKTAMAECEATAMSDPEGVIFPQKGLLQNAGYTCYVSKIENTGYTILLEVKGTAYAQTYEGKVVLDITSSEEKTVNRTKRVVLSAPPGQQPSEKPQNIEPTDEENPPLEKPSEETPEEPDLTEIEQPIKKVSEVLWSIK